MSSIYEYMYEAQNTRSSMNTVKVEIQTLNAMYKTYFAR